MDGVWRSPAAVAGNVNGDGFRSSQVPAATAGTPTGPPRLPPGTTGCRIHAPGAGSIRSASSPTARRKAGGLVSMGKWPLRGISTIVTPAFLSRGR